MLRNLSRGKGVGFFEENSFFPDFILWVIDNAGQRIIFIEPHGMLHAAAYIYDEKARLHEKPPGLAKKIEKRSKKKGITLVSFSFPPLLSMTCANVMMTGAWDKNKFAEKHILFLERNDKYDYIKVILH